MVNVATMTAIATSTRTAIQNAVLSDQIVLRIQTVALPLTSALEQSRFLVQRLHERGAATENAHRQATISVQAISVGIAASITLNARLVEAVWKRHQHHERQY